MRQPVANAARTRGFALVAALFLLVVIAALGTVAIRMDMSQRASADLALAGVRAEAALQTGVEYAAARLLAPVTPTNDCDHVADQFNIAQNFTVAIHCEELAPVANTPAVTVFSVQVTAFRGAYGSPDFVSRRRTVRITL